MKRKSKKYSRPQRPFDKARIDEENIIRDKYGLKNKKEIWKADAAIRKIRNMAKDLITGTEEEKTAFVKRLQKKGFDVENIADVLALDKENWLKRRLQTIVFDKKLVQTPKQARQLIVHKHISVDGRIINIPSYQVSLEEEPLVKLEIALKTPVKKLKEEKKEIEEEKIEESKEESKEETKEEKEIEEVSKESEKIEEETKEKEIEEEESKESKEDNKEENKK